MEEKKLSELESIDQMDEVHSPPLIVAGSFIGFVLIVMLYVFIWSLILSN